MKSIKFVTSLLLFSIIGLGAGMRPAMAQLKIGYINSNKVLEKYKDAIDVRKQLADLNEQWKQEARGMEKEIQGMQEQMESQSLLLSEERKAAKQQEIQTLYLKYQQYLQDKWNPQGGEAAKKEVEMIQPVYEKINVAISKIGETDGYDYVFDVVAGNVLYASPNQPDLTEKLLAELNKGLPESGSQAKAGGK